MVDKNYCMSHYLAFRFVADESINFFDGLSHKIWKRPIKKNVHVVDTADGIDMAVKEQIESFFVSGKTAVFLSGGIDSAILASYLPRGTKAYTFHCNADGAINETCQAKMYADAYGLSHEVINMEWKDFVDLTPELFEHDGVPFHSIEVQLLKAVRHAQAMGVDRIILGDGADSLFGGLDGFLSKDRTLHEFRDRFAFVKPEIAIKDPVDVDCVYQKYLGADGFVNAYQYMQDVFAIESTTSYMHVFDLTGIKTLTPYCSLALRTPLDINRIRSGEPKYLLRELFSKRYPQIPIPKKIPMPRATTQWFANWGGPIRPEFIPGCHLNMTGDQKWQVWCLEQFLNRYDR